jgi:hypothetical protein
MPISINEAKNIAEEFSQVSIEPFRNSIIEIRNIHSYSWAGCEQYHLKELTTESFKSICDEFTIKNENKPFLIEMREKLTLDLKSIIDLLVQDTQLSNYDTQSLKITLMRNLANCGHINLEESVTTAMEIKDIDAFLSSFKNKE